MTPDRIIYTAYAILKPDGQVASDGGPRCIYDTKSEATEELRTSAARLSRINSCNSFRVAPVRLVEITPPAEEGGK